MNLIDAIIIALIVVALVRGAQVGALRQVFSTAGFFGGLFLGAWIEPHFAHFAHTASSRSWLALIITLGLALIFLGLGEYLGVVLKNKIMDHHKGEYLDRGLGSVVGVATLLITIWLSVAILTNLPFPQLQKDLRASSLVRLLDENLPSAPGIISRLSHVIDPNGFPEVFAGTEPAPINQNVPLPPLGALTAGVVKDEPSIVKIEGDGCGGIVEGSGFVVAPGLVATNAHVVAGVERPYVFDQNGQHSASVIWFDPNLDFAVLSVRGLAGTPLSLDTATASNGSASVVVGYPGGGNFTASPAVVLDEFIATGRNIYDQGNTNRNVYEIKATVVPGNSGGPLILANGSVIGIVFAESTTYNQVGYALTMPQVVSELHQAEAQRQTVSTGACAA